MYKYIVFIHILSATVWTGGHLILSITVLPAALKNKSIDIIKQFGERFDKIGIPALVLQFLTGLYLAYHHLPNVAEWFSFKAPVSHLVVTKLLLLVITAGMILRFKLKVQPKITNNKLKTVKVHIIAVTIISVLFVFLGVWFKTGSF